MSAVLDDVWGEVERQVDRAWDAEVAFLRELVRRPSTLGDERAAQERVVEELRAVGLEATAKDVDHAAIVRLPGYSPADWAYRDRPNVAARLGGERSGGQGGGRSLVLNGHIDVVPATPERLWSVDPWGAEIVGERMYGRGAADMKAGIAAMLYAVAAIRRAGVALEGDVLLQTVIEEECTGNGSLAAVTDLAAGGGADAAIIPEPFDQTLLTAQIGVLWARITVLGAGAHVLGADRAVNANDKAAFLMQGIRALEAAANEPGARHRAYREVAHPLNYNVGVVRGGDWPSSVPSECVLEVRFSAYPGADLDAAQARFRRDLLAFAAQDPWLAEHPPEIEFYGFKAEGCLIDTTTPLFEGLRTAHRAVMGDEALPYVSTATTDVRFFAHHHGIPSTCYGPVGANLHAPDEWVDLPSVRNVTKVLARATLAWCGVAS